jgi:arylsulfatase A-like enzyme
MSSTVAVVTADHGEGLGERGFYFEHGESLYDFLLHIPLILDAPGLEPGRVQSLVSAIDLAPTLVDLASVPPPESWVGKSLVPVLHRAQPEVRTYLVSELPELYLRAVRDHRWKLIVTLDGGSRHLELYDTMNDPQELYNLAAQQPAVAELLEVQLSGFDAGTRRLP